MPRANGKTRTSELAMLNILNTAGASTNLRKPKFNLFQTAPIAEATIRDKFMLFRGMKQNGLKH